MRLDRATARCGPASPRDGHRLLDRPARTPPRSGRRERGRAGDARRDSRDAGKRASKPGGAGPERCGVRSGGLTGRGRSRSSQGGSAFSVSLRGAAPTARVSSTFRCSSALWSFQRETPRPKRWRQQHTAACSRTFSKHLERASSCRTSSRSSPSWIKRCSRMRSTGSAWRNGRPGTGT